MHRPRKSHATVSKIQIPDALKATIPQNLFGRILSATPVIMTVIATMLAGLASSEMTKAQYDRSLAAQEQAKAGDQWSLFQQKRLRGSIDHATLDILQSTGEVHPLDPAALRESLAADPAALARLDSPLGKSALAALSKGELPATANKAALPAEIENAFATITAFKPDAEIDAAVNRVTDRQVTDALASARAGIDALDAASKPLLACIDAVDEALQGLPSAPAKRNFAAARLRLSVHRYNVEARLNQTVASLIEIQVRKSNLSAERFHERSKKFFYGMLGAQMAVIFSTFAIAASKRSFLWGLAAAAGIAALLFAGYVYLYV